MARYNLEVKVRIGSGHVNLQLAICNSIFPWCEDGLYFTRCDVAMELHVQASSYFCCVYLWFI